MKKLLILTLAVAAMSACQELKIETYDAPNYVSFTRAGTDTTNFSFFFYRDDEVRFPLEVQLIGKSLAADATFSLAVNTTHTTLDAACYTIPQQVTFRAGQTVDTVWITLKNASQLLKKQFTSSTPQHFIQPVAYTPVRFCWFQTWPRVRNGGLRIRLSGIIWVHIRD